MTSLLLAFEDTYFREFDRALRRALDRLGGTGAARREQTRVDGVGKFAGFVRKTWPIFRDRGFPKPGSLPIGRLLCVADADAVVRQLPNFPPQPAAGEDASEWVVAAEARFEAYLREHAQGRPDEVFGALIRWNYESLVIATIDHDPAVKWLGGLSGFDPSRRDAFLSKCSPDPRSVEGTGFTDAFAHPQKCLAEFATDQGWPKLKKGDLRKDQAVQEMTKSNLDVLLRRVPDLVRVARRLQSLCA